MAYSNRTCVKCGWKDIQPNMKQIEIEYESGSSKDSGSVGTYIAANFFNDKAAQRRVNKTTWSNNKRKYTRKRKVWVCKSNCGNHSYSSTTTTTSVSKPVSTAAKPTFKKPIKTNYTLPDRYKKSFLDKLVEYLWLFFKYTMFFCGALFIFIMVFF